MKIKSGVRVLGVRPEMVLALIIAESIYDDLQEDFRLTSCVEGVHSRASIHYAGGAGDTSRPADLVRATVLVTRLRESLGNDFDVILESDHIHIEFQPKDPL